MFFKAGTEYENSCCGGFQFSVNFKLVKLDSRAVIKKNILFT